MMVVALVLTLSPWGHTAAPASARRSHAGELARIAASERASAGVAAGVTAGPEASELEEAGRAFAEGVQAYKEGRYEEALERFSRAQALAPHPDTLFNLGLAQQRMDQHVEAWRSFDELLAHADDDQEREDILVAQAASRSHVAWVTVLGDAPGVVCLDGQPMPPDDRGRPALLTTPGTHRLDVDRERRTLHLEGGESRTLELPVASPGPPPPRRGRLRALAGLTIGGAGAAASTGLGAAFVEDRPARLGLGITAAATGTLALTSTVIALVVHRRARTRWQPPPPLRECPGP